MALEEQLEQLCFGTSMPKLDSCLGLYLSPDVLFLAEAQLSGGRPKISHLIRLPLPASAMSKDTKTMGSLNTEFLADHERIYAPLAKALGELRWKTKHVMVTLSNHFAILRYFTFPAIDRRFWKTAIPAEAKKYIPIPFANLAYDFQVASSAGDRRRQGSLFGVTDKKNLTNIEALMTKLGLTLIGVEPAPCSVERLWDTLDPGTASKNYAQVHFDGGEIRILVSEAGVPIFFREAILSGEASLIDRRKVDLAGCVDFTTKQLGASQPAAVRVSGQTGDIESWRQAFSQDLGQNVQFIDVDKALGLRGGQWGGYAAIGSALRRLGTSPIRLDISNAGKISDMDRRAAFTMLKLSAFAAALLGLVGLYRYGMLYYKMQTLRSLQRQVAVLDAFRGKRIEEIESTITLMQNKVNFFSSVTIRKIPLTRILAAIADTIPDQAWVTQVDYDNPLSSGPNSRTMRTLSLSGRAIGATRAAEQDIAFQFTEKLGKNTVFHDAFPSIEPSVETPPDVPGAGPLSGGDSPDRHTLFKIACGAFKGGRQ